LGSWGRHALRVEHLGNADPAVASGAQLEDPPDDCGLGLVDDSFGVTVDADVSVAEARPAGDVAGTGLSLSRFVVPLAYRAAPLGVHLGADESDDVIGKRPEAEGLGLLIEPRPHPEPGDLLQLSERLVTIAATETGGIPHDEDRERGTTPADDIEESLSLHEPPHIGAGDGIVAVDVRIIDGPALGSGEEACSLDLTGHRLGFGIGAVLLGRFAGVNGRCHSSFSFTDSCFSGSGRCA
jgi:hypothetical protein